VLEYAAEVVAIDAAEAIRILTLGSQLRAEAHEIDAGEPASEIMYRLLVLPVYMRTTVSSRPCIGCALRSIRSWLDDRAFGYSNAYVFEFWSDSNHPYE